MLVEPGITPGRLGLVNARQGRGQMHLVCHALRLRDCRTETASGGDFEIKWMVYVKVIPGHFNYLLLEKRRRVRETSGIASGCGQTRKRVPRCKYKYL
jgi:hypothetical protein